MDFINTKGATCPSANRNYNFDDCQHWDCLDEKDLIDRHVKACAIELAQKTGHSVYGEVYGPRTRVAPHWPELEGGMVFWAELCDTRNGKNRYEARFFDLNLVRLIEQPECLLTAVTVGDGGLGAPRPTLASQVGVAAKTDGSPVASGSNQRPTLAQKL